MQLYTPSRQLKQHCVCSSSSRPHARLARHAWKRWGHLASKDTSISRLLRSTLGLRDQVLHGTVALCPPLADITSEEVEPNLSLLNSLAPQEQVRSVVIRNPGLLAVPLDAWHDFFRALGMDGRQFWQLLSSSPGLLLHGSVFQTGGVIMFLQAMGWSDLEISTIIIPHHTAILQMDVSRQLQPVVDHLLQERGMAVAEAKAFLHQHPDVLYTPDYQAAIQHHIRRAAAATSVYVSLTTYAVDAQRCTRMPGAHYCSMVLTGVCAHLDKGLAHVACSGTSSIHD